MKSLILFAAVVATATCMRFNSEDLINHINSLETTWRAAENPHFKNMPESVIKQLGSGVLERPNKDLLNNAKTIYYKPNANIPKEFDARNAWPKCKSIGDIKDQGPCGSCWAMSIVETITDRLCINRNGTSNVEISVQDLLTCCEDCGKGCIGGYSNKAWDYYYNIGIASGGDYNSSNGCKPYEIGPCEHDVSSFNGDKFVGIHPCGNTVKTPLCKPQCASNGYQPVYTSDRFLGSDTYWVSGVVEQIQQEIMTKGPVQAIFSVYADFFSYESGVYQHHVPDYVGLHAIKIIGWGEEPNKNGTNVPYWLVANSWNTDWGEKGLFKILRGADECGIEGELYAGTPDLHLSPE